MRIRRVDGVQAEHVEGRSVLLRAERLELVTLNPTGSLVWEALAEPRDLSELVDEVRRRHPAADPGLVAADVERFVASLQAQGLIVDVAG